MSAQKLRCGEVRPLKKRVYLCSASPLPKSQLASITAGGPARTLAGDSRRCLLRLEEARLAYGCGIAGCDTSRCSSISAFPSTSRSPDSSAFCSFACASSARSSADSRPVLGHLSANSRPSLGHLSAMSRLHLHELCDQLR